MAIRFQCPSCKVIRAANERLLGREINCPECGNLVQLPTLAQIKESRQVQEQARREEQELTRALQRILVAPSVVAAKKGLPADERDPDQEEQLSPEEKRLAAATTNFLRPKTASGEDMDMTPMVDVTFLLLIFFMITASFSVQKSIQRPAQRNEDPSTQAIQQLELDNPDIVRVQVDEFNAYNVITTSWDRIAGSKQDLIVALIEAHTGDSSGTPSKLVVEAHEDCIHAAVVAALDAGREAQFENFEVSTVEQFD